MKLSEQKPQDEATALREYGLRIAEAVRERCAIEAATSSPLHAPRHIRQVSVAAIVASVELPEQEILDAPNSAGWYWARSRSAWMPVRFVIDDDGMRYVCVLGAEDGYGVGDFNAWLPLTPPSTPSPADAQREGKL